MVYAIPLYSSEKEFRALVSERLGEIATTTDAVTARLDALEQRLDALTQRLDALSSGSA